MTWFPERPHGMSGHVYEIIDYYLILYKQFNLKILFGDTVSSWKQFKKIITDKYQLNQAELKLFEDNTIYADNPEYIKCRNIFFVDGSLNRIDINMIKILAKIITFKCAVSETIHDRFYKDVLLLQDNRVYIKHTPEDVAIANNYVKKIYFDKLKQQDCEVQSVGMFYLMSNCRDVEPDLVRDAIDLYNLNTYIILTDNPTKFEGIPRCNVLVPPVTDVFKLFTDYIYTPLKMKWDGSPRFIAECRYFNKNVHYYKIDNEYLEQDTGLKIRKDDISNNWNSLFLRDDDDVIDILRDNII